MTPFGDDLPRPDGKRLFLYLLGPGVGESQVVVFPDGRTLVVDSCIAGGVNLPRALLAHLGLGSVDLLVLTHPDLDHVRGFAELVRESSPAEIWRYPHGGELRAFAADLLRRRPGEERLADLAGALDAIDDWLERHGEHTYAQFDRTWSGAGYEVRCLAPTPYDVDRARRLLEHCTAYIVGERRRISPRFERFLAGKSSLGDAPNVLSVALAIGWGQVRIVLGGDVEKGTAKPFSGWKGVLSLLDKPCRARGDLVTDVHAVKVAHHGSRGAFHEPVWDRHARPDGSTVAVLTPFKTTLPTDSVLQSLTTRCERLGITKASPKATKDAAAAGWKPTPAGTLSRTPVSCVVVVFEADGTVCLHRGGDGAILERPAPAAAPPPRST